MVEIVKRAWGVVQGVDSGFFFYRFIHVFTFVGCVCVYTIQFTNPVVGTAVVPNLADHLNIYSKRSCSLLV